MIGWKVREIYRELEEGGGSWGRKQEKKEAHVERKAEGKSGDKLETAAVKAIQEAINRTPRRPKALADRLLTAAICYNCLEGGATICS
ncbi:hypothetical protein Q9233_014902 [Columba guinea]|nr:hypothetical protein Q9233_014902 [Columba guinea]